VRVTPNREESGGRGDLLLGRVCVKDEREVRDDDVARARDGSGSRRGPVGQPQRGKEESACSQLCWAGPLNWATGVKLGCGEKEAKRAKSRRKEGGKREIPFLFYFQSFQHNFQMDFEFPF
jgi:hypothetical protein